MQGQVPVSPSEYYPVDAKCDWEGWFWIAIGDPGSELVWCKTHIFRRAQAGWIRRHPLAEAEGLNEPELLTVICTKNRLITVRESLGELETHHSDSNLEFLLPPRFQWTLNGSGWRLARTAPRQHSNDVRIQLDAPEPSSGADQFNWVHISRILNYQGRHLASDGQTKIDERNFSFHGLSLIEHAWGSSLPFNPAQLVPGRWHWDVLLFDTENMENLSPPSLAGLNIPVPGLGNIGIRSAGRFPGQSFQKFSGFQIKYEIIRELESDIGLVPIRWRGRIYDDSGVIFEYIAIADTPVAPEAPGGGFFGFNFEGEYGQSTGSSKRLTGRGFCEYGGQWK